MHFFNLDDLNIGDIIAITIGVVLAEILIQLFVTPMIAKRTAGQRPAVPAGPGVTW